jgi:glycosyltransferase involved in cell wall biosynthesis
MKITIVTPSFNQRSFIEEALWSVKNQGDPSVEHIVMDGASTDGTVEVLRDYSARPGWEHLRWFSQPDKGQSDALNQGFRMAQGDLIGWLNSDDRYRAGCFGAVTAAFGEHASADLIYGDYTLIDAAGRYLQIRREIEFNLFILLYHKVLYIPSTATFFRRSILDDGVLLDDAFQYAMDYEFFMRLAHLGYRFQHIPDLLADFRWHHDSKTMQASHLQAKEQDAVVEAYSPILRALPGGLARRAVLMALRWAAGMRRYSEKALRGYYFQQFRPNLQRL